MHFVCFDPPPVALYFEISMQCIVWVLFVLSTLNLGVRMDSWTQQGIHSTGLETFAREIVFSMAIYKNYSNFRQYIMVAAYDTSCMSLLIH
jgi:hypothetical protein